MAEEAERFERHEEQISLCLIWIIMGVFRERDNEWHFIVLTLGLNYWNMEKTSQLRGPTPPSVCRGGLRAPLKAPNEGNELQ